MKLFKNIIIVIAFSTSLVFSQKKVIKIFSRLNLSYPGLEEVQKYVKQNQFENAKIALLRYFQNRNNRKEFFTDNEFNANIKKAEKNIKNIFTIHYETYNFGDKIDWTKEHKDKEWKFSLGRMKWFLNYVGTFQKTKDEKYVNAWMRQFKSWYKLGDPGYPRTIDTGRRMENLVESYIMLVHVLKAKNVTPDFNALFLLSLDEQAEFIYNPEHWRRYSNWGTFENSGFALFSLLFPEFKRDKIWVKESFFRMRAQLHYSYYPDGMHVSTSPAYQQHELSVWFDFIKLAKLNNIKSPWTPQMKLPTYRELIVPKAKALMYMYKPNGKLVQVGDADAIDERGFLKEVGEYFNEPELIYVATDGKKGKKPREKSKTFPNGGYAILRSGWGNDNLPFNKELYLLFAFGNNKPWHAHYAIFNVVASAYNYDLLIDPGRFTYNSGAERDAFKSTAYHNTVVVNSRNQMKNYKAPLIDSYFFDNFDYLVGSQNSYSEVTHTRSIFFANNEYWIIIDRLSSESKHTYKQYWHLNSKSFEKVKVNENRGNVNINAPHLMMFFPKESNINLQTGYQSRHYGKKEKTPVIVNSIADVNNALLPVVIYPFDNLAPEIKLGKINFYNSRKGTPIALKIETKKYSDFYFERTTNANMFIDKNLETNAKVIFIRENNNDGITQIVMIAGDYLKYKNKKLVSIAGKNTSVAIANDRVNVKGNCVTDFIINISKADNVYLNSKKISVKIIKHRINYHLDRKLN